MCVSSIEAGLSCHQLVRTSSFPEGVVQAEEILDSCIFGAALRHHCHGHGHLTNGSMFRLVQGRLVGRMLSLLSLRRHLASLIYVLEQLTAIFALLETF